METIWYVLSISLQVSGALLLILEWCRKTETLLVEKYFTTNAVSLAKNKMEKYCEICETLKREKDVVD